MGIKSNLLVQVTKYNNKRVVEFTLGFFNALGKLFSFGRKKEPSHSREDNQHLNDALVFAIENLNSDIVELLVNSGADVNSLDKNNKNAITHAVERLATSKGLSVDPSKNLPEEISSHTIVQFLLVKGSKYYSTDNMDIEGKYTLSIKGNVGHSLQSEPIYEEIPAKNTETQPVYNDMHTYEKVDGFGDDDSLSSGYSSIKELRAQRKPIDLPHIYSTVGLAAKQVAQEQGDEHIYEEMDHFRRDDNSLDSCYSSIEKCATHQEPIYAEISDVRERENPLYVSVEECKTQKKSIDSSKQEPIYTTVDLAAKRSEGKAKSIKANSGTYHGLVKDRKNQWEEKINKRKLEANTTTDRKEELHDNTRKTFGANVERIRQKYESGYDSGYDFDTKVEQSRKPKAPNSKVNSVHVEYGIVGGCRHKITDISL
ncbi:hypothetical protein [Wolbachia endosymbiont of Tettigetta isshikii]|uniref:hypothetical protein n=1 Tax=Wolbachia endosymbiont of Tettigetta isshikii TaxID=3239093 RepID=UPI00397E9856